MSRFTTHCVNPLAVVALAVIAGACTIVSKEDDDSTGGSSYQGAGGTTSTVGAGGSQLGGGNGGASAAGAGGTSLAGAASGGARASTGGAAPGGQAGASSTGTGGSGVAGALVAGAAGASPGGQAGSGVAGAAQAGNGGGSAVVATSSLVRIEGASFVSGNAPAAGTLAVPTVTAPANVVNGGTARYEVTFSGTNLSSLLVSVNGDTGYFVIPLTAGAETQTVAITLLAGYTGSTLTVGFALRDGAGNISAWSSNQIPVVKTGVGELKVTLTFDQPEDLDLRVTDPLGNTLYYDNVSVLYGDTGKGGHLDLDSNAACVIGNINNENIFWDPESAPSGTYLVEVSYYRNCSAAQVNYTVTVSAGAAVTTYAGSFVAADAGEQRTVTTFSY